MAKPSGVSGSTRRRSNSTASSGGNAGQDSKSPHKISSSPSRAQRRSGRESLRSKKKPKGLTTTRSKQGAHANADDAPSSPNVDMKEAPIEAASGKTERLRKSQSTKASGSSKALANGHASRSSKTSASVTAETNGPSTPRGKSSQNSTRRSQATLLARDVNNVEYSVRLIVGSEVFVDGSTQAVSSTKKRSRSKSIDEARKPPAASSATTSPKSPIKSDGATPPAAATFMGNDGNLYYCNICRGFGNVVCCDGCPRVFHHKCVPEGTLSRISLDNDDERWYCPNCTEEGKADDRSISSSATPTRASGKSGRAVKRRCCECHLSTGSSSLEPCEGCGTYLHFPSCKGNPASPTSIPGSILCSTCRSEMALMQEETELKEEEKFLEPGTLAKTQLADERSRDGSLETSTSLDEEFVVAANGDHDAASGPTKKRKVKKDDSSTCPSSPKPGETPKKKKRKKKKHDTENGQEPEIDGTSMGGDEESSLAFQIMSKPLGTVKAIPAFYFFLGENRFKIERVLAKKHRVFYRLPKGSERNELVAKEAAAWWAKLTSGEAKQYIDLSMRDYQHRIIEWKEEKNIRDMLVDAAEHGVGLDGGSGKEKSLEDEKQAFLNHERLYLGTTVGSKPFNPEPGESHNRVLLELLQDMRFHPVPMMSVNRTKTEHGLIDHSAFSIPYFDVHGPVSTSVGDECLGCTRGWAHFCSVLKRRIPAVESRAKLQPPLSALLSTRVGLGLRYRPVYAANEEEPIDAKEAPLFVKRDKPLHASVKHLPYVACDTLSNPSGRGDDIVQFIEEVVSMKIPEPPRPQAPEKAHSDGSKKSLQGRGVLPTRLKKKSSDLSRTDSQEQVINKCGRCRTIIQTDTGCMQCRRAQLVINLSRKEPKDSPILQEIEENTSKLMKVQSHMLGRVTMKEGSGESQSDGDRAISEGILKQRWTPCAILPPRTVRAPDPNAEQFKSDDYYSSDADESFDSSTKDENDSNDNNARKPSPRDGVKAVERKAPLIQSPEVINTLKDEPPSNNAPLPSQSSAIGSTSKASKRVRSARIVAAAAAASTISNDTPEEEDRQQLAKKFREEANELQKKTLSIASCGILLALMRRDPLLLFASPVTAEGYSLIIRNPIDFGKIRKNVLSGKYATLGAFVSDARLLCTNALAYNPPGSIYWKTAKELLDVLIIMQKRASGWMGAIKDAHASACRRAAHPKSNGHARDADDADLSDEELSNDRFDQLRQEWPEAMEVLENGDWLRRCLSTDFMRTKENEAAYYGSLAVRRAAIAAETSLAPYPTTGGMYSTVSRRTDVEDNNLRNLIDEKVAEVTDPVELKDVPTWREEFIMRVMRCTQSRRLDGRMDSENGCARCDGVKVDQELKTAMQADIVRMGRSRRKGDQIARIAPSRIGLSMGTASQNAKDRIKEYRSTMSHKTDPLERFNAANKAAVSVNGSRIHGWGLFAEQAFKKGDVVAEYVGEYVSLAVTEAREQMYQDQRIQDYQFRLDDSLVIDATLRGGHGRYINHNCNPNCKTEIIPGPPPNEHLKRVLVIAARDIKPREELSYDYQFPLELDFEARIPCNCQSDQCRGFMNWDLPEKGSNNLILRTQKRGANMRDRIRRLGRPLKGDK